MRQLLLISILLFSAILFAQAPELLDTNPVRVTNTWDGSSSTAWNNNSNWSLGHYPTLSEDVEIPVTMSGRYPIVTGSYSCNSVSMEIGTSLEIGNGTLSITGGLTSAGAFRMTNELAVLNVQDMTFNSGSTMYIPYNGSEINVSDDVSFNAGSNINPTYGDFTFTGGSPSITTNVSVSIYTLISSSTNLRHVAGVGNLTIKGNLTVLSTYSYVGLADAETIIYGTVFVDTGGTLQFNAGMVVLKGNNTTLTTRSGNYFNNLLVNKTAGFGVTLNSNIDVNGNLTIYYNSSLIPGTYNINLGGNWTNYAGDNGFLCYYASNCQVIFDGTAEQTIYASEDFDHILLNKVSGFLIIDAAVDVWCYAYSRVSGTGGGLIVYGSFDVYSLWDASIDGSIYVSGTLNMHQILQQSVNITGYVHVADGTFNIYGGTDPAYFTETSWLQMSGGIMTFHDVGISLQDGFGSTITGGILKTPGNLEVNTSSFDPTGGTIELFGNANSTISCVYGATFHHLQVNKDTGNTVDMASDLDINGSLEVASGIMRVYWYTLKVAGNLTEVSSAYLQAPEGILWLDGTSDQMVIATTEFETLVLDNSASFVYFNNANFTCELYDWQDGSLDFYNSTFTANDLADPGLYGSYHVHNNSTVNLYQDTSNSLYCPGYMGISTDGTVNIYGGNTAALFTGTLYMNSGVLNIVNSSISLGTDLIELISGGTIVSHGYVTIQTEGADLSGSTLQMLGAESQLNMVATANLGNLLIAAELSYVEMTSNAKLSGSLSVQQGSFLCGHTLYVELDVYIYSFMMVTGTLQMNGGELTVQNGGTLSTQGNIANPAYITSGFPGLYYHNFTVMPGGSIWATYTVFEYMGVNGINIMDGATVSENLSFHHCTFRNGVSGGTLLKINNNQDLTLFDVTFPENTWGSAYNVSKTNNEGSLHFVLYMGTFGGQSYEQDPNGRINWSQMQVPPVENLTITYLGQFSGMGLVRLDWDYPIAEATYVVYHSSTSPYDNFTVYATPSSKYIEIPVPTTTVKRFYWVTAVLEQ